MQNMADEIQTLKDENQDLQDTILTLYSQINDGEKTSEEELRAMLDSHKENLDGLNQKRIDDLQQLTADKDEACNESKKEILKMLNERFTESTEELTEQLA